MPGLEAPSFPSAEEKEEREKTTKHDTIPLHYGDTVTLPQEELGIDTETNPVPMMPQDNQDTLHLESLEQQEMNERNFAAATTRKSKERKLKEVPLAAEVTEMSRVLELERTPEEEILASREITEERPLPGGNNVVRYVTFKDDGAGISKPRSGENSEILFGKPGTYYKREFASYLVSRFLGFNLVPPTVIREKDGDVGSVQRVIPNAHSVAELEAAFVPAGTQEEFAGLWIFDYIIWNIDRHKGNCLSEKDRIWAIDNGLSFNFGDPMWIGGMWLDKPIPAKLRGNFLTHYVANPEAQEKLHLFLSELLSKDELDACMERIERVKTWMEEGMVLEKRKGEINYFGKDMYKK